MLTINYRVSAGLNKSNLRLFKTFLRPLSKKFKTYKKYEKARKNKVPKLLSEITKSIAIHRAIAQSYYSFKISLVFILISFFSLLFI